MAHHLSTELFFWTIVSLGILGLYANMLNPFAHINRVKRPYYTLVRDGAIVLERRGRPTVVRTSLVWMLFAYYKCGWHIVSNVRAGAKAKSKTFDAVIADIHRLRFDPRKPYLISGDHFNVLYPRNLGVFYHATLDPRAVLGEVDWQNRQRVYLQTVAFALEVFAAHGDCTTTIVPVGARAVCCINIYRYPSDALYGILYALSALRGTPGPYETYFSPPAPTYTIQTTRAAEQLLEQYRATLALLLGKYVTRVYDEKSGFVRTDVALSSAKDAVLRESSFYDNVIFWKTCLLAQELGVLLPIDIDFAALKKRILDTFWLEDAGHFLDDLSAAAKTDQHYSADWLAVLFTGFLDARDPAERHYLRRAADYTIAMQLDMPLPLRYQESNRAGREVLFVRCVVPSYGGSAIWSFWGAEFIKLLTILAQQGEGAAYADRARQHIATYEQMIAKYKGYPEVYTTGGAMLRSPLYQSVRQTGWVVGFEQARELLRQAGR